MNNIKYFDNNLKKFNTGDMPLPDAITLCQGLLDSGQLWRYSNKINIQVNSFINNGHVYKR